MNSEELDMLARNAHHHLSKSFQNLIAQGSIPHAPDLSQEEFIRIWHEDHREVAIETQSTFGYVRQKPNQLHHPL